MKKGIVVIKLSGFSTSVLRIYETIVTTEKMASGLRKRETHIFLETRIQSINKPIATRVTAPAKAIDIGIIGSWMSPKGLIKPTQNPGIDEMANIAYSSPGNLY